MARTKAAPDAESPADPDRLERQQAGTYRTPDGRFEVREADAGWFVVDTDRTNEFGQELIHGPYPTLKAARNTLTEHRSASNAPKRPATKRASSSGKRRTPPPPPPRTWIDDLEPAEKREVRRVIAALEATGVGDAEAVVRRDRDGLLPAVAIRLIEDRLAALLADVAPKDRDAAGDLVRRTAEILSSGGAPGRGPLPGWALVELAPGSPEPPNRRIDLRS